MEGRSDDRITDGRTSSDRPRANNENKGDGVSLARPGAFSSSATRSERLRAKMEGGSNDRKRDGVTSSEQPKTNNENRGDGVLQQDLAPSHHLLLEVNV